MRYKWYKIMNSRFFNAKQSKKSSFWHLKFNMNTHMSHKQLLYMDIISYKLTTKLKK